MKFTIRVKLLSGFFIVLALLLVISTVSIFSMSNMGAKTQEIDDKWMPSATILGQINEQVSDLQRLILKYIVETDSQETNRQMRFISNTLITIKKDRKEYEKLISSSDEKKMYEVFSASYDAYVAKLPDILREGSANEFQKATQLVTEAHPLWETAKHYLSKLIDVKTKGANLATQDSVSLYTSGRTLVLIFSIVSAAAAIATALIISQMISKPLIQMSKLAEQVASGDLTGQEIKLKNRDELGALARSFNSMIHNLREMIQSVSKTSEQVAASSEELTASAEQSSKASEQIAATIEQVAVGTNQQVESVRSSSQSVREMSSGAEQIASSAQSVSASAINAAAKSSEGNNIIQHAVTQMDTIHQSITTSASLVTGLGERSNEIGNIIEVITDIANQTNLLALNAAIEAARAGENGRGFAVVANEVRKLAEQSSQSAQQISELVKVIQEDTNSAVESMAISTNEVSAGIEVVASAGKSFEQILQAVNRVAGEIQEVSASAEQMSATTDDIVNSIRQISTIAEEAASGAHNVSAATEQQLASMEEITASANSLSVTAEELQELIKKFKV